MESTQWKPQKKHEDHAASTQMYIAMEFHGQIW